MISRLGYRELHWTPHSSERLMKSSVYSPLPHFLRLWLAFITLVTFPRIGLAFRTDARMAITTDCIKLSQRLFVRPAPFLPATNQAHLRAQMLGAGTVQQSKSVLAFCMFFVPVQRSVVICLRVLILLTLSYCCVASMIGIVTSKGQQKTILQIESNSECLSPCDTQKHCVNHSLCLYDERYLRNYLTHPREIL